MSNFTDEERARRRRAIDRLIPPTPEEDATITAAAEADPDNPPLTEEDFARMRPSSEAAPEFVAEAKRRRGQRGPGKAPNKVLVTLRLSPEVVAHFQAGGEGWRTRIDETLKKVVARG